MSVDEILDHLGERCIMEETGLTDRPKQVEIDVAKNRLCSLLISKLPEKMVRSEVFEGESDGTIEAYNSAIDDMHRVIDEMFEVHNEK